MDIRLKAGQTLRCALRQGSRLVMLEGSATLEEAPAWLADKLLPRPARLREGDCYLGADGGLVVVTATAGCRFLVLAPDRPWQRLVHRLVALAAKARRRPRRLQASA